MASLVSARRRLGRFTALLSGIRAFLTVFFLVIGIHECTHEIYERTHGFVKVPSGHPAGVAAAGGSPRAEAFQIVAGGPQTTGSLFY